MNKKNLYLLLIFLVGIGGLLSFQSIATLDGNLKVETSNNISELALKKLALQRIFFGHQSVGKNIIGGIKDISSQYPEIKLNVVKTNDSEMFDSPIFAHSRIGKNRNPQSKFDAYSKFIESGIGDKTDIAMMKLCYVDISSETNIKLLFDDYKSKMSMLEEEYPETKFVHLTVPIVAKPTGINLLKDIVKKIIGRPIRDYRINLKRAEFNKYMREEYLDKSNLFDLALLEATSLEGTIRSSGQEESNFPLLDNSYTDDGAHLNKKGRKYIAEQLLIYLASL